MNGRKNNSIFSRCFLEIDRKHISLSSPPPIKRKQRKNTFFIVVHTCTIVLSFACYCIIRSASVASQDSIWAHHKTSIIQITIMQPGNRLYWLDKGGYVSCVTSREWLRLTAILSLPHKIVITYAPIRALNTPFEKFRLGVSHLYKTKRIKTVMHNIFEGDLWIQFFLTFLHQKLSKTWYFNRVIARLERILWKAKSVSGLILAHQ